MDKAVSAGCAEIFREVSGLNNSSEIFAWSDERLLNEPMETFDLESLTVLALILEIESAFSVELDEEDVNRCKNVGDLAVLVAAARNGSN
jgi:acyl carrier protein